MRCCSLGKHGLTLNVVTNKMICFLIKPAHKSRQTISAGWDIILGRKKLISLNLSAMLSVSLQSNDFVSCSAYVLHCKWFHILMSHAIFNLFHVTSSNCNNKNKCISHEYLKSCLKKCQRRFNHCKPQSLIRCN